MCPPGVWALYGQGCICLVYYRRIPTLGPGLWMLHKYLPADSPSGSGQSWDLDPGMSDFQGSLRAQALADPQEMGSWGARSGMGPAYHEGFKDPNCAYCLALTESPGSIPHRHLRALTGCHTALPGTPQEGCRPDSGRDGVHPSWWTPICNLQSASTQRTH